MAAIYMKTEEIPEIILDEKSVIEPVVSEKCSSGNSMMTRIFYMVLIAIASIVISTIISALLFFNDDKISRNFTIFIICGGLFLYLLSLINESFWNVAPIREGTHIAIMRPVA